MRVRARFGLGVGGGSSAPTQAPSEAVRKWAAHTAHGKDRPRKHLAQEVQAVEPAHRQRLNRGDNIHPLERSDGWMEPSGPYFCAKLALCWRCCN